MKTIKIYRFIDPSFIVKDPTLIKVACGANQHNLELTSVLVNKQTGHFVYSDNTLIKYPELKRRFSVPQTEPEARKAVADFLKSFNKMLSENNYLIQNKFPNLFSNLQYQSTLPILDPANKKIERWDVKYLPFVYPSNSEEQVAVMNGEVVFRIGIGGKLTGLKYSWMPIERSQDTKRNIIHLKDENGSEQDASIIYMIEPDKNLCAPYLLAKDDTALKNMHQKIRESQTLNIIS
jgi:hypothetical protein